MSFLLFLLHLLHNSRATAIVGGDEVTPHSLPFIVSIQDMQFGPWHFCAGSLLNERLVLTTARCCREINPDQVQVVAGKHNLFNEEPNHQQEANIKDIRIHPDWDETSMEGDICLIELESSFTINSDVGTTRLPLSGQTFAGNATVAGWGATIDGGQIDGILRKAEVPLIPKSDCERIYEDMLQEDMLCAGGGNTDACQGDAGGPLLCGESGDVLCGLVSWGVGCGIPSFPGVYTSVAAYLSWLP